jgi:dihydroxyacetone kinase-like predicted kinase
MDDDLIHAGGTSEDAVLSMLAQHYAGQEIVTVFSGAAVTAEQQQALTAQLQEAFPVAEIEAHTGGPDLYDYLVTME